MSDFIDLAELLAAVQRFCESHFPGMTPTAVVIAFKDQPEPARLPVPPYPVRVPQPRHGPLSARQEDIVAAVEEAPGGEKLSGKEVAKRAGYEYDSTFRADLSHLCKTGRLKNLNPGYTLPDGPSPTSG